MTKLQKYSNWECAHSLFITIFVLAVALLETKFKPLRCCCIIVIEPAAHQRQPLLSTIALKMAGDNK